MLDNKTKYDTDRHIRMAFFIFRKNIFTLFTFLSMLHGKLNRNFNRCSTPSAFLVASARSFLPSTSLNNVSADLLDPANYSNLTL